MPWVTINGAHVLIGEDDGNGPGKAETTLNKAVTEMRLHDAKTAVTEVRAKGWHVNFEHAEPSTDREKRVHAKAKLEGKTAVMFTHEPHVEVTQQGDRTTHAYDQDQAAYTYPHPTKPGKWVSEQHVTGYRIDTKTATADTYTKTFSTKEKALAASAQHATRGYHDSHLDRGSKAISTSDVGKGVRDSLKHFEQYHDQPDTYQIHIKVLK
jgi:hypothetical protein